MTNAYKQPTILVYLNKSKEFNQIFWMIPDAITVAIRDKNLEYFKNLYWQSFSNNDHCKGYPSQDFFKINASLMALQLNTARGWDLFIDAWRTDLSRLSRLSKWIEKTSLQADKFLSPNHSILSTPFVSKRNQKNQERGPFEPPQCWRVRSRSDGTWTHNHCCSK